VRIVGIGGSTRPGSSTELLVRAVLDAAADHGAETALFSGEALVLPPYEPGRALPRKAQGIVRAVREADALVFGSPGYHGTMSGLVKNALDYLEELSTDARPYVDGLPVACVVTARGWQAAVNTLRALRETVHALRGWPTPLGLAVNVADGLLDESGAFRDPRLPDQVRAVAGQLVTFARTVERTRDGAVAPGSAVELVRDQVRRAVASGRYAPGDRLPGARDVAAQLGVTTETARRALAALAAEGLVEIDASGREPVVTVCATSSDRAQGWRIEAGIAEFEQVIDFRLANECAAARLAATRRTEADLVTLRDALARMHRAAQKRRSPGAVARFHRADTEFHVAIARACGNPLLEAAVADGRARLFLPLGAVFSDLRAGADDLHDAILDAIASGDGERAAATMAAHIEATRSEIESALHAQPAAVLA
jgi:FMN reductase